jgi:hypothetical protein
MAFRSASWLSQRRPDPRSSRGFRELGNRLVDGKYRKRTHTEEAAQDVLLDNQAEYREEHKERAECS